MAARKLPPPEPLEAPAFTTDRMRLLAPLITPRVLELARRRLCGESIIGSKENPAIDDPPTLKIALLVVYEMNPHENFYVAEEGLIRGMDKDGVNPAKKAGLIRPL